MKEGIVMESWLFWAAALLALVFALNLARRFRTGRAPFYLWWSFSFYLYVLTFGMEALTVGSGYGLLSYQIYIVSSAGLVGFMSVGTMFLAVSPKWGKAYAVIVTGLFVALVASTFLFPPSLRGTWLELDRGLGITGLTQVLYIIMAALGGTLVFVGAVWSWWKTKRHYNLLIAVGVLVSSAAGSLASQGVGIVLFPFLNMVGLVLIFLGYIYARAWSLRWVPSQEGGRQRM